MRPSMRKAGAGAARNAAAPVSPCVRDARVARSLVRVQGIPGVLVALGVSLMITGVIAFAVGRERNDAARPQDCHWRVGAARGGVCAWLLPVPGGVGGREQGGGSGACDVLALPRPRVRPQVVEVVRALALKGPLNAPRPASKGASGARAAKPTGKRPPPLKGAAQRSSGAAKDQPSIDEGTEKEAPASPFARAAQQESPFKDD